MKIAIDFMFLVVMLCVISSSTMLSHNLQFSFSFQDITLVC